MTLEDNSPDPTIRLALVELLPRVSEFIREAIAGTGIEIVPEPGRTVSRADLVGVLGELRAQVVILPPELAGVASECHELFQSYRDVKVLTIAISSKSADVYELRFLGKDIGLAGIPSAIHRVVGESRQTASALRSV